jgi:hypothetical protein
VLLACLTAAALATRGAGSPAPRCLQPQGRSRLHSAPPPPSDRLRSRCRRRGGRRCLGVRGWTARKVLRPCGRALPRRPPGRPRGVPETNALSAIGPHPDGGVRFFGVTNQVETLLLAPVLAAAATSRRWLVAIGLLALVALGWSRAGADGGGVLVLLAGLGALVLQDGIRRISVVRVALVGAAVTRGRASPGRGRCRPWRLESRDRRRRGRPVQPCG